MGSSGGQVARWSGGQVGKWSGVTWYRSLKRDSGKSGFRSGLGEVAWGTGEGRGGERGQEGGEGGRRRRERGGERGGEGGQEMRGRS